MRRESREYMWGEIDRFENSGIENGTPSVQSYMGRRNIETRLVCSVRALMPRSSTSIERSFECRRVVGEEHEVRPPKIAENSTATVFFFFQKAKTLQGSKLIPGGLV